MYTLFVMYIHCTRSIHKTIILWMLCISLRQESGTLGFLLLGCGGCRRAVLGCTLPRARLPLLAVSVHVHRLRLLVVKVTLLLVTLSDV